MDGRIIYSRDKKLWRGRECTYPGCTSTAATQCDGASGEALTGNVCAEPLCNTHRHRHQQMDFCHVHRIRSAPKVSVEHLTQTALF